MARVLGVTSSFLSAVENGKRPMPQGWSEKIATAYNLSDNGKREMEDAVWRSASSVHISLEDSGTKREAALAFARAFDGMDEGEAEKFHNFLKQFDEED